jgi:hypothetical protein
VNDDKSIVFDGKGDAFDMKDVKEKVHHTSYIIFDTSYIINHTS